MFLDNLLQYYSRNSVLPKHLIYDLVKGYCLPPDAAEQWHRYFAAIQQIHHGHEDYRAYISVDRLQTIENLSALCYMDLNDHFDQLQIVLLTIQQLLVEYGLFLAGPMTLPDVQAAYDQVRYQPCSCSSTLMQCDGVHFQGFQFSELHTRLLKFIYHAPGGLFQVQDEANPALLYINRYILKIQ